jgi:hypothetical protein
MPGPAAAAASRFRPAPRPARRRAAARSRRCRARAAPSRVGIPFQLGAFGQAQRHRIDAQQRLARKAEHAAGAVADVEHRHVAGIDQEDGVGGGVHRAAEALQLGGALAHLALHARAVLARLLVEQAHFQQVADAGQHLDRVEGLADEVARPGLERGQLLVRLGRHHQHRQPGLALHRFQGFHHLEAVHVRHLQVEDDQVVAVLQVQRGHLARVGGARDLLVAGGLEQEFEQLHVDRFVVDDQDACAPDVRRRNHELTSWGCPFFCGALGQHAVDGLIELSMSIGLVR